MIKHNILQRWSQDFQLPAASAGSRRLWVIVVQSETAHGLAGLEEKIGKSHDFDGLSTYHCG